MGGLGLGVLAVYSIAGLLHSGRSLGLPRVARAAALLIVAALCLRVDLQTILGAAISPQSLPLSSGLWAAGILIWLACFGRYFARPLIG